MPPAPTPLTITLPQGKIELKHEFIRLRAKGVSLKAAAECLNVGIGTLCEWGKALELEIASARAIELEALQETFFLLKEKRIESLGKLLAKLDKELDLRDYSEVDTVKLLDHRLKVYQELKTEFSAIQPVINPFGSGTKPT